MTEAELTYRPMLPEDADDVLAVQVAAFGIEARLYGDPVLPPLVETAAELVTDLAAGAGFVALLGDRLVGSVRVRQADGRLHIARLSVAPDQQGRGIGTALLSLAEKTAPAGDAELFTGHLSAGNLRLYERAGYVLDRRVRVDDHVTLVYLRKPLG